MKDVPDTEKQYPAFMVNRGLSYFQDTVLFANEMNRLHHTPVRMQYDFLLSLTRKRKRFAKWHKKEDIPTVEVIKEYYGYSQAKAEECLDLFPAEQIDRMKAQLYRGGTSKK